MNVINESAVAITSSALFGLSVSGLQRRFNLGYAPAKALHDALAEALPPISLRRQIQYELDKAKDDRETVDEKFPFRVLLAKTRLEMTETWDAWLKNFPVEPNVQAELWQNGLPLQAWGQIKVGSLERH